MRMTGKIIGHNTFWIFLLCSAIVISTQFLILQPILKYSLFTADDWHWLLNFRSLTDLNLFEKLVFIWTKIDIRQGAYVAYVGILGTIFGNNYSIYQYVTIIFKALATLTLFPLILILFRSRFLAFLTTIIYGINSASTGSFYWYMKGGIFPAIAFMNLFFISYYFTLIRNSRIFLILSSVLIFLSYLFSPTRIFPILLIVSGVEIYWLHKHKSKAGIKNFLIRLICLLLPSILISLLPSVDPTGKVQSTPHTLLKQILDGNWSNLLSPLQGIGFSLLTNENMKIFGNIDSATFSNLNNYLVFIFKGSFWILLSCLGFLGVLISKKPLRFVITAMSLNLVLDVLMFYLASYHFFIPHGKIQKMDPSMFSLTNYPTLPTLVAIFILVIAFMTFFEWFKEKKNYLLIAIFIGPIFSLIFLASMWITIGDLLNGYNSMHYYYQIPAIGISLFLAAILSLFFEKFKKGTFRILASIMIKTDIFKFYLSRRFAINLWILPLLIITGIILYFYFSSSFAIDREFLGIYSERVEVKEQQVLHERLVKKLGNFKKEDNILVYFELPQDSAGSKYYERSLFLNTEMFEEFVFWHKEGNELHCVGHISIKDSLKSSISFKGGRWGFILSGRCLQKSKDFTLSPLFPSARVSTDQVFYSVDSLYAYKIDKGELIDIKGKLIKELNLQ